MIRSRCGRSGTKRIEGDLLELKLPLAFCPARWAQRWPISRAPTCLAACLLSEPTCLRGKRMQSKAQGLTTMGISFLISFLSVQSGYARICSALVCSATSFYILNPLILRSPTTNDQPDVVGICSLITAKFWKGSLVSWLLRKLRLYSVYMRASRSFKSSKTRIV